MAELGIVNTNSHMTVMIDGKVCSAIIETSSKANPIEMNGIDVCQKRPINTDSLAFGLSTLHAWIRFFGYCLHISFRLTLKKWRINR